MILAVCCLAAYFLGAIPSSYIVGKLFFNLDLREHGSGNVGATNALRVLGTKIGILVLAADMAKGAAAIWLAGYLACGGFSSEIYEVAAGASAILGHIFTIFLKFKGGKGVATAAGVFLALVPKTLGLCFVLFFVIVFVTRYVSLGSILSACAITPLVRLEVGHWRHPYVGLAAVVAFLIIFRHRTNVSRLLSGTENKFGTTAVKGTDEDVPE